MLLYCIIYIVFSYSCALFYKIHNDVTYPDIDFWSVQENKRNFIFAPFVLVYMVIYSVHLFIYMGVSKLFKKGS